MKRYFLVIFFITGLLFVVTSCKKGFLEVNPKAKKLESNYYRTSEEAFSGLVAAYDPMGWEGTGAYAGLACLDAASDECYGGGASSSDMPFLNTMNDYTIDAATGPQQSFWNYNFAGVSRCNTLISKLTATHIPGLKDALKKRYIAESRFLRAYYYFKLVRLFGYIPLYIQSLPVDKIYKIKQVEPEAVYAQIERDLKDAIKEPNLPDQVPKATEGGRITKGTAHALLGKVFLYEKKYEKAAQELSLVNGTPGGTSKYGYHLLDHYADIFDPANKFNSESVLEITHTSLSGGKWGTPSTRLEGFATSLIIGPRSFSGSVYYSGWGGCPISKTLYNDLHGDPRFSATVLDLDSLVNLGLASYAPGYENTGHFIKKFAPLVAFKATKGAAALNYSQDYIEIRLAGTYLMEAEALVKGGGDLGRAAALLNAVRARVGLSPEEPTLKNIYHEQYLELATEGHRWFNLIRTERAVQVLGPLGFEEGKNEILPIPLRELTNTQLVQNKGY